MSSGSNVFSQTHAATSRPAAALRVRGRGSSGRRVAQAISGATTKATPSAMKGASACAVGPNAPEKAAAETIEAISIAPTPTGLMS